jgi:hypothetical protein
MNAVTMGVLKTLKPRVDFTNMLKSSFTHADPKSAKRQSSHQCLALLGSVHAKVVHKNFKT